RNQKPEARSQKPEARSQKPDARRERRVAFQAGSTHTVSMLKMSEDKAGGRVGPPLFKANTSLHDKQSERDPRELRIDKVGVRGLRFPIQIRDKAKTLQNTVATIGMFVDLPKEFKGTHMSRFLEVLNAHGNVVHVENITEILHALQKKLHATTSHLEMEFPFFLT